MKARIKFSKMGSLKFIGHLDVMRYFQKAFRRAEFDVVYSKGFSPHQELSFASPLGIGLTSEGEYLDIELNSTDSKEIMIKRLNDVMVDGIEILDFNILKEGTKNAMSSVIMSDYRISIRENYYDKDFFNEIENFYKLEQILIVKQTKRSEKEVNIKPMIYELKNNIDNVFLKLATGSVNNLKPELVMQAYCNFKNIEYKEFAFIIHRLETYFCED